MSGAGTLAVLQAALELAGAAVRVAVVVGREGGGPAVGARRRVAADASRISGCGILGPFQVRPPGLS